MIIRGLTLAAALSFVGCASGNPVRDNISDITDTLTAGKWAPLPTGADLDGVWLDGDDKALAWVKTVDGEVRVFIQDSMK